MIESPPAASSASCVSREANAGGADCPHRRRCAAIQGGGQANPVQRTASHYNALRERASRLSGRKACRAHSGTHLLDSGALVSLLDRSQGRRREFTDFFETWAGQVVTTEAVLAESTHLLAGGALLVPATAGSLRRARDLMKRYADCPMDFADASLVVLAEDIGTNLVLTTDRRDFSIYRLAGRKRFRICI